MTSPIYDGGQMVPDLLIASGGFCTPAFPPPKITREDRMRFKLLESREKPDTPESFYFQERFETPYDCGDCW